MSGSAASPSTRSSEARAAIDREAVRGPLAALAAGLGGSLEAAAEGVLAVADAAMERALRVISVERGYDPADFAVVAFGGAGALHVAELTRRLGAARALVPPDPGLLSAYGMLASPVTRELSRTVLASTARRRPGRAPRTGVRRARGAGARRDAGRGRARGRPGGRALGRRALRRPELRAARPRRPVGGALPRPARRALRVPPHRHARGGGDAARRGDRPARPARGAPLRAASPRRRSRPHAGLPRRGELEAVRVWRRDLAEGTCARGPRRGPGVQRHDLGAPGVAGSKWTGGGACTSCPKRWTAAAEGTFAEGPHSSGPRSLAISCEILLYTGRRMG